MNYIHLLIIIILILLIIKKDTKHTKETKELKKDTKETIINKNNKNNKNSYIDIEGDNNEIVNQLNEYLDSQNILNYTVDNLSLGNVYLPPVKFIDPIKYPEPQFQN
jgi:capsular polysaccharide biosynthesis protein